MKPVTLALTLAIGLAGLATTGCTSTSRTVEGRDAGNMKMSVWQSAKKVNVNEAVTFEATESNTLGRNAKLNWEATGGKLWSTDSSNRIVQVQYTTPGVYSVTATLTADNQQPQTVTRTVDVRPITP